MAVCHLHGHFCLSQSLGAHILPTSPGNVPREIQRAAAALPRAVSVPHTTPSLYHPNMLSCSWTRPICARLWVQTLDINLKNQ